MFILDTTIRDGSYAVDFKFTCGDVKKTVSKLSRLGIKYVEIGHGQGLDASSPENGISLCTDCEYLDAAKEVSGNAQIGMFCIPGIAHLESISQAKEHGLSFIRIGITVEKVETAIPYIMEAKRVGITPMVNFMKTYVSTPEAFAQSALRAWKCGAQVVYIVDSAGCMMPEDLKKYIDATHEMESKIVMGFHGHNNLGMAVANSICCAENGVEFIDCSFQGLGRSLGNTPTEMFIMALKRKYPEYNCEIDIPRLLEYGYVLLKNISPRRDVLNPLDLICGYSGFHSSFLKDIYKCCEEKEVDPLRLIIAYSSINQKSMDYQLLCKVADGLPKDDFEGHPYSFRQYFTTMYNDR